MKPAALLSALLLTSCTSLQVQKDADLQLFSSRLPRQWTAAHPISEQASTGWVSQFGSSIQQHVTAALASNHGLQADAARITELRALARASAAPLYPLLDIDGSSSRSQRPTGTRFESLGAIANRFQSELNISWELDFWGKNRDRRDAALTQAQAAEEDLHAARLSLAANVVKAALSVLEFQQLAHIATGNVASLRSQVEVQTQQVARGINADRAALDLSLARADLARAEATLTTRQREADAARRSLQTQLGHYPSGSQLSLPSSVPQPSSSQLRAGLPSQLLLRRPDIRAAERRIQIAVKEESAAKKEFLPSIRLSGGKGYSSQFVEDLFTQQSALWTAASSLAQPLLTQGRLSGNVKAAQARYQRSFQQYLQTALTAFREVETALAADHYYAQQVAALQTAVTEADRAQELARSSYERGLSDMLTVLDSTRRAVDAHSALLSARIARAKNRADLHLALGGQL